MLFYEAPAVYQVIMQLTRRSYFPEPKVEIIEIVCSVSSDPSLKKPKFRRYFDEYAEKGLYCGRAKKPTAERDKYYASIRAKKTKRYIQQNALSVDKRLLRVRLAQKKVSK